MQTAEVMPQPGKRRIYSNYGFDVLGRTVAKEAGIEFGQYLRGGLRAARHDVQRTEGGAPAAGYGATSTVADLAAFAADLLRSTPVSQQCTPRPPPCSSRPERRAARLRRAAAQRLGSGFEIRNGKSPTDGLGNSVHTTAFRQPGTFICGS